MDARHLQFERDGAGRQQPFEPKRVAFRLGKGGALVEPGRPEKFVAGIRNFRGHF